MLGAALAGPLILSSRAAAARRPNVLVLITDDQSYATTSLTGSSFMKTPNIDRIGREGILFTDHYAHPSSTPGRGAFITGQLPIRTGLTTVGLPEESTTRIAPVPESTSWNPAPFHERSSRTACSFRAPAAS